MIGHRLLLIRRLLFVTLAGLVLGEGPMRPTRTLLARGCSLVLLGLGLLRG